MNFKMYANKRVKELKKIILRKNISVKKAPTGHLRIVSIRGSQRYYHRVHGEHPQDRYLSVEELNLIRELAQKPYDQAVLKAAEQELRAWEQLAKFFPEYTVEEIYETLSPARQKLVTPIIDTDEEFRRKWEAVTYEPGRFKEGQSVYITDRGERVRSKSEQLIANLLNRLNIPYRYEYPLEITVNGEKRIWRPDFMILDVKNRREFFWEHLGMLDSTETNYAKNAFWKMKVYEANGLYEGNGMYYSFETQTAPLDIVYIEMKVRRILGMEPMPVTYNTFH